MTNEQYDRQELARAEKHERQVNAASLIDRKAAREDMIVKMRDPKWFTDHVKWLLGGDYGRGIQIQAQRVMEMRRGNRVAGLSQLVGVACGCTRAFTVDAWKALSPKERKAVDSAVAKVIAAKDQERADDNDREF